MEVLELRHLLLYIPFGRLFRTYGVLFLKMSCFISIHSPLCIVFIHIDSCTTAENFMRFYIAMQGQRRGLRDNGLANIYCWSTNKQSVDNHKLNSK
jgi:hypothetical protein